MSPSSEFIHWIGRLVKFFGLEESIGIIWGFILLKGKPVTQREIVEETGYSTSLVSSSLSKLERLGFITCIGKEGRRKLYRASKSFLDGLESYLKRLTEIEVNNAIYHLSKEAEKIKDSVIKKNAERILNDYEKLKLFLNSFIEMMHKYKHLSKEELSNMLLSVEKGNSVYST